MNIYKGIKINGEKIDEHRFIMEKHLGRKLKRNEVVHHIDGNKRNNNINNLKLMTLSEHSKMHRLNHKMSYETKEKIRKSTKGKPSANRNKTKEDIIKIALKYKQIHNYQKLIEYLTLLMEQQATLLEVKSIKNFNK